MKRMAIWSRAGSRNLAAALVTLATLSGSNALAQTSRVSEKLPPVRELSAPVVAEVSFSNILNVRQIAGGQVLVNDPIRRQLVLLDNKLAVSRVLLDSVTRVAGEGYGPAASVIIAHRGDSTFFLDRPSSSLLVIDPNGKIARTAAVPIPARAFNFITSSASAVDYAGNLLFRAVTNTPTSVIGDSSSGIVTEQSRQPDSTFILRANFELRKLDTIARLKQVGAMRSIRTRRVNQMANSMRILVSPIETLDDWTTLSDGIVAIVRGGDYHVDFLRSNGQWDSGAKLPFDWKPLTDADKQRIVDSTRAYVDGATAKAEAERGPEAARIAQRDALIGSLVSLPGAVPATPPVAAAEQPVRSAGPGSAAAAKPNLVPYEFIPFSEMPSYFPPLRMGYTKGDADGNLWILPTTSAQSKAGELVYDVVNGKGELTKRVRVPLGRTIAGFGAGGIVYLVNRDSNGAWHLERTQVVRIMK